MPDILVRPILTEKMTKLQEVRQYAFEVPSSSNKIDIERAVEKKFKVKVLSVRTQRIKGKEKVQLTRRGRFEGRKRNWKKALVTLKEGDKIDYFENV
ncbi:MAG TPA: 50S ribosomal protein L23 [Bacteroidota bacterium]